MGLRNNHIIGDSRQEHVDNHNLIEPLLALVNLDGGTPSDPLVGTIDGGNP